jgi:plastocyanin
MVSISDMNKFLTPTLNIILVALLMVFVVIMPSNVFALYANSIGNSNTDITFVGSPSNTSSSTISTNPSQVVDVITISEGKDGKTVYIPSSTTIKVGDEILIANNTTSPHSFTNGNGPNDPLSGKLFNTGMINPKGFAEYVATNLMPGKYAYYSTSDPSVKGEIVVVTNNQQ